MWLRGSWRTGGWYQEGSVQSLLKGKELGSEGERKVGYLGRERSLQALNRDHFGFKRERVCV